MSRELPDGLVLQPEVVDEVVEAVRYSHLEMGCKRELMYINVESEALLCSTYTGGKHLTEYPEVISLKVPDTHYALLSPQEGV